MIEETSILWPLDPLTSEHRPKLVPYTRAPSEAKPTFMLREEHQITQRNTPVLCGHKLIYWKSHIDGSSLLHECTTPWLYVVVQDSDIATCPGNAYATEIGTGRDTHREAT